MELITDAIDPVVVNDVLNWRYATKVFDNTKKIPQDEFELLLESLRLSPSSIDVQPWKFIVVNDPAVRQKIFNLSMLQTQMTDASHLILLCSLSHIDRNYIDRLVDVDKKQSGGNSIFQQFKEHAVAYIESKSNEQLKEWMAQQVYIALGFLLSACAMLKIDACPMEAFDHDKVNDLLKLKQYNAESRVAVALGYRSEKDFHAKDKKLRWPKEEVIITI